MNMNMKLEPAVILTGKIAAVLGIVQGITWAVLSLVAIITSKRGITFESLTTYSEFIGALLYTVYLDRNSEEISLMRVSPKKFHIFMWIYYVASVCWIGISVDLFLMVVKTKKRYRTTMMLWSALTCAISILDVALFGLVLADYDTRCYFAQYGSAVEFYSMALCHTAAGIVMTLAARGFTLWGINVILAALLFKLSRRALQRKDPFSGGGILQSDYSLPRVGQPTPQYPQYPNQQQYRNEPRPRPEQNRERSQPPNRNHGPPPRSPRKGDNNKPYYNNNNYY